MKRIPAFFVCAMFGTALVLLAATARAQHGSHGPDARGCHMEQHGHQVHYTAYRAPDENDPGLIVEWYCEEVPATGLLRITFDLIDQNTREQPVALRLLALPAENNGAPTTLLDLPSRIYPSGSIGIDRGFERAGRYEFQLRFGQKPTDADMMKIAFSVGQPSWGSGLSRYFNFALMLAGAILSLWLVMRWQPDRTPPPGTDS